MRDSHSYRQRLADGVWQCVQQGASCGQYEIADRNDQTSVFGDALILVFGGFTRFSVRQHRESGEATNQPGAKVDDRLEFHRHPTSRESVVEIAFDLCPASRSESHVVIEDGVSGLAGYLGSI